MTPATAGTGRTDAGAIGALGRMGIVPIVVIDDAGQAAPLAETLLEAGIAAPRYAPDASRTRRARRHGPISRFRRRGWDRA